MRSSLMGSITCSRTRSITRVPVRFAATFLIAFRLMHAAPAGAQAAPASTRPLKQLPPPVATSEEVFASLAGVRALSNGRVLLNDHTAHRVVLLDEKLATSQVVADSTSQTNNSYGARPGGLIAFHGDSTLFVDPASLSILVIDPAGRIARVMAVPRPAEAQYMTGGSLGNLAFDTRGALVYRGLARPGPQPPLQFYAADSALVSRLDFASRKLDTVGFFRIQKSGYSLVRDENSGKILEAVAIVQILPTVDDWSVMTDGTIAIVRGQDYHVQFVDTAGRVTQADKIPFAWARVSDAEKRVWVDSTRARLARRPPATTGPQGTPLRVAVANPSELPDYRPAFEYGGVRSDTHNRIWVRTSEFAKDGGIIYDVIARTGKRVDRVRVPANASIVAFGPDDAVYLGVRENNQLRLAKSLIHVADVAADSATSPQP